MHWTNESLASQQSRSALPRLSRQDSGISYAAGLISRIQGVTVGNSDAIWIWAGSITISRSHTSFQKSISALYSYRAPVQPALGPLCALQHEPELRFICGVWAKHVQRCRYNIQLSNRTGRLWWVTDQNKDGVWMRCHWRTLNSSFLFYFFVLCLFYHFKWQTVKFIYFSLLHFSLC